MEYKRPCNKGSARNQTFAFPIVYGLDHYLVQLSHTFYADKISTSFWIESQTLPFHVSWPFQLHDPSKHPIAYIIIFVSQSTTMLYFLIWLGVVENMGVSLFFELTSALRVLCIELRNLQELCLGDEDMLYRELCRMTKFHQQIIL